MLGKELPQAPPVGIDAAQGTASTMTSAHKKPAAGTVAPAAGLYLQIWCQARVFTQKRQRNQPALAARSLLRRRFFHIVQPDIATPRPAKTIVEGSGTTTRLPV